MVPIATIPLWSLQKEIPIQQAVCYYWGVICINLHRGLKNPGSMILNTFKAWFVILMKMNVNLKADYEILPGYMDESFLSLLKWMST